MPPWLRERCGILQVIWWTVEVDLVIGIVRMAVDVVSGCEDRRPCKTLAPNQHQTVLVVVIVETLLTISVLLVGRPTLDKPWISRCRQSLQIHGWLFSASKTQDGRVSLKLDYS